MCTKQETPSKGGRAWGQSAHENVPSEQRSFHLTSNHMIESLHEHLSKRPGQECKKKQKLSVFLRVQHERKTIPFELFRLLSLQQRFVDCVLIPPLHPMKRANDSGHAAVPSGRSGPAKPPCGDGIRLLLLLLASVPALNLALGGTRVEQEAPSRTPSARARMFCPVSLVFLLVNIFLAFFLFSLRGLGSSACGPR